MAKQYRKFKMTRKRADWVGNRNATLRGEPMRANESFANRVASDAEKMVRKMHLDVSKQVNALFDSSTSKRSVTNDMADITTSNVAMDASIASQARILMNKLTNKWVKRFNNFSGSWSENLVSTVSNQTARDLKKINR